ncbi:MAG: hypothetical protein Q9217_005231 [Psora testacea]
MSDNPSSPLLGAEQSRRPASHRSPESTRSQTSQNPQCSDEASPLLANDVHNRTYGNAPAQDGSNSAAASSLRSLQDGISSKKRRRRWPSVIAYSFLCVVIIVILGLGFASPAIVEEYAKEAIVFEPTGLAIDSFTSTGIRARIQGDFKLDGSKVHKKPVRDLGRVGTWIAKAVESKQSKVDVYFPEYDDILLGTAVVPPIAVSIRDGVTTHVDFICDLSAGDLDGLRRMANDWLEGRIGRLSVRGVANVPLKSGLFGLGTQSLSETVVFGENELPTIPKYNITKLNFHEVELPDMARGMAADVNLRLGNEYPVKFTVPPLGFHIMTQACSPDLPYIGLANASTEEIHVIPKDDVEAHVTAFIRTLPDTLTSACPNIQKSPLDLLLGEYIRGDITTVYVRGAAAPSMDTPEWVVDFMKNIVVPVDFPGRTFNNLIRNFSLSDVHFGMPDPFSSPDSPDSQPRISATVNAMVGLPKEMDFPIDIPRVKAAADIYYHNRKLGQLDLCQWQNAKSKRVEAHGDSEAGLAVSSTVKNAPLNITDDDVFATVVQALIFGGQKVVLGVKADVDVETETVLGKLVVRDLPAEGKVFVKRGGKDVKAFAPEVGDLRILETAMSSVKLEARINITNPTEYSATVPYVNIKLLSNGTELGHVTAKNVAVGTGVNRNILVNALWDPPGEVGAAQGREFLSQYISGFNTTLTLQTHAGTIPGQPAIGLALSNFSIEIPTPSLHTPKNPNPSKPDRDRDPSAPEFIDDATFHILTSTASFTLLSPLPTTTITITYLNATAFYNHTLPVGGILYELPFEVPPGVSTSPRLPVSWDIGGLGYQAVKEAVGGRLKFDARADVGIKVGSGDRGKAIKPVLADSSIPNGEMSFMNESIREYRIDLAEKRSLFLNSNSCIGELTLRSTIVTKVGDLLPYQNAKITKMLSRTALRASKAPSTIARRNFRTSATRLSSPYHYPEGPYSNIPFNPKTRFFFIRYWSTMAFFFGLPFGIAVKSPLLSASCWDAATDSLICAFGPSKNNVLIELKRWKKYEQAFEPIVSWDAPCPLLDLDHDEILDIHYFSDTLTICIVFAGGDLVVVREDPQNGEDRIEIVGSVDVGLSAAVWSPDEELLALATRASTLLYMTRDFESCVDVAFTPEDLKASNLVSVGWGKKETQFKGKKARALRDPTMPETVDKGVLHRLDTNKINISWRGDGAYLAVNSIDSSNERRIIRVYSREGVLDSVSEPVDYLLGAVSWRPAGNIIVGIQYLDDVVKVVFFERNGLRHGQFNLRLATDDRAGWASDITLKWNVDSSVLAVCFKDRVQLWTMSNYHYYLKQEIICIPEGLSMSPLEICWHPEKPLHFASRTAEGIQRLAYALTITSSPTSPPNDYGVIAVIDGRILKLTPMRVANVPPPMALHELEVDHNVTDVAITHRESGDGALLLAVLYQEAVSVFSWALHSLAYQAPSVEWRASLIPFASMAYPMSLQVAFGPHNSTSVLQKGIQGPRLQTFDTGGLSSFDGELDVDGEVETLVKQRLSGRVDVCIVANSRHLTSNDDNENHNNPHSVPSFHMSIQKCSTHTVDCVVYNQSKQTHESKVLNGSGALPVNRLTANAVSSDGGLICFRLDEHSSLFANQRCLIRNCTSFLVTPAHLILTTSQQLLKFVHLAQNVEILDIPPDMPETDERCRSIERGTKLVTVIPSIFALVLQMPRGNLETIYPRALVLAGIRDNINRRKYKNAFLACRNHRVDMNILHDHAPAQFLANVGLFIDKVKKVEHIDLFLSQLREEDVSKTMYKETLRDDSTTQTTKAEATPTEGSPHSKSKINRICDAFIDELSHRPLEHLQNIISAHVCKAPPDLGAGLMQIAKLRKQNSDQVDSTVEHICFLADVNKLYDNALGLYDLELTLLIAQQSQKDPREYLPFLQNLQKMPKFRRQHSIDDLLGRHAKALRHLCDLESFDEVKLYTVKHNLYAQALEHYRYQGGKFLELMRLHADYLQQEGRFKDAGIAYEYLGDYKSASESFRQAHLWRESLSNASMDSLPHSHTHPLALSLVETLIESKDFYAAATIYLDYLADIPAAARLFCKGYHFAEATRIVGLHKRLDLLESVIDQGLIEGMVSMTELLADCKVQLNTQVPRIRELRIKKAEDPLAFWDGDIAGEVDVPDNVSITPTDASTTGVSLFTRYTNRTGTVGTNATRRTSKNRRREERKRARGKKGSVYEEEYLVNSIGRLIDRVNAVGDEISRLATGLMRRAMRERALAVESAMVEIVEMCKGCLVEVFQPAKPVEKVDMGPSQAEMNGYNPQGGDGVFLESLEESSKPREAPIVKDFERLSLLGG